MSAQACVAPPEMVDVAFELAAPFLPCEYEWPLFRALARVAPWLESVQAAGVHPLRATPSADGTYLLARRAKLVVRLPRDRVCAASILEGAMLDLGGGVIAALGHGTLRSLEPAPTVYSARVVTGDDDEAPFTARVAEALDALGVHRPIVCGKRSRVALAGGSATAFSVAVHGLGDTASLLLQRAGIGGGRAIGCGLFVPHKAIVTAA